MRIILDAMGSDNCPEPEIEAVITASQQFNDDLILVGPEAILKPRLENNPRIHLVNATDTITMEDKGMALALKAKRNTSQTSMAIGIDMVKNGQADAFVTAGNTGGALATAYFRLGTIPGIERPALTANFPIYHGNCVVLDIGANPDCKPEHLLQFALMGSIYANKVRTIENPRIGLLSNGEEGGKGNELVKAAYALLKESTLNFIGNVEGKELFNGAADVVVTDGFTGNVLLKSSEAVAKLITTILKEELKSGIMTSVGALFAKPAFTRIKAMMDPDEFGAAPLLGVNGLVFIGHGRSNARALISAIKVARQAVEADILNDIKQAL
jgi:glycerol-3-phosphate acyltransferase PlsX